jgi:hypothetical protein
MHYCVGCGRFRVLVAVILLCTECYGDWLRLTPVRLRDREMMPREAHARAPAQGPG